MWIFLALLSASLLGFYDVFKKRALRGNAVIPVLFLNTLFCSLFFLPLIVASAMGWVDVDAPFFLPPASWDWHKFAILKAVIVLSCWLCGYYAIKHLPLTIVGPINALRPVMTLVGALLIYGERLNLWQWVGVLLALLGLYLLSRSGKKEGIQFTHNRWIWLLLLAAMFGSASGLYDKFLMMPIAQGGLGMDKLFVQGWFNLYQAIMMLCMLLFLWWPKRRENTAFRWHWSIPLISLFLTLADLAYYYALSSPEAMISVVSMVRRGSVLVSFAFGAWLFHEKNLRSKALDLFLVLLSMLCLFIGTL